MEEELNAQIHDLERRLAETKHSQKIWKAACKETRARLVDDKKSGYTSLLPNMRLQFQNAFREASQQYHRLKSEKGHLDFSWRKLRAERQKLRDEQWDPRDARLARLYEAERDSLSALHRYSEIKRKYPTPVRTDEEPIVDKAIRRTQAKLSEIRTERKELLNPEIRALQQQLSFSRHSKLKHSSSDEQDARALVPLGMLSPELIRNISELAVHERHHGRSLGENQRTDNRQPGGNP